VSLYVKPKSIWRIGNSSTTLTIEENDTFVDELNKLKSISNNNISYDLIIISISSFKYIESLLILLTNKVNEKTLFLIDANYGVCLESLILDYFPYSTVLSCCCNIDIKIVGNSRFQILNYENENEISISIGFSCFPLNGKFEKDFANEDLILTKISESNNYLNESNTILEKILNKQLQLKFNKYIQEDLSPIPNKDNVQLQSYCSLVWFNCIKMISFDVLSVIFEEFDYSNFLNNDKIAPIYSNVIQELITIAISSGAPDLLNLFQDPNNPAESLVRTFENYPKRNIHPLSSKPKFIHCSNITFCYAYKINLPNVLVMLFQPLIISHNLKISSSTLGFIYGIYNHYLNINGSSLLNRNIYSLGERKKVMKTRREKIRRQQNKSQQQRREDPNNDTTIPCPGDEILKEGSIAKSLEEDDVDQGMNESFADLFFDAQQIPVIGEELEVDPSQDPQSSQNITEEIPENVSNDDDCEYDEIEVIYSDYETVYSNYESFTDDDESHPNAAQRRFSNPVTDDGMNILSDEAEKYKPPKRTNGGKMDYNSSVQAKLDPDGRHSQNSKNSISTYGTNDRLSGSDANKKANLIGSVAKRILSTKRVGRSNLNDLESDRHKHNHLMELNTLDLKGSPFGMVDSSKRDFSELYKMNNKETNGVSIPIDSDQLGINTPNETSQSNENENENETNGKINQETSQNVDENEETKHEETKHEDVQDQKTKGETSNQETMNNGEDTKTKSVKNGNKNTKNN